MEMFTSTYQGLTFDLWSKFTKILQGPSTYKCIVERKACTADSS